MSELKFLDILFDGPPSHDSPRFVEVERDGKSIRLEWVEHTPSVFWSLRVPDAESVAISVTYTEEVPTFRRGLPTHELESLLTPEECAAMVAKIKELRDIITRAKDALDSTAAIIPHRKLMKIREALRAAT